MLHRMTLFLLLFSLSFCRMPLLRSVIAKRVVVPPKPPPKLGGTCALADAWNVHFSISHKHVFRSRRRSRLVELETDKLHSAKERQPHGQTDKLRLGRKTASAEQTDGQAGASATKLFPSPTRMEISWSVCPWRVICELV
jgi:hypothetical protein